MTYQRVIPRDLFNEANLLKCYGRIYINLEVTNAPGVVLEHVGGPFVVIADYYSGDLSVENVKLLINGTELKLFRPLNSREEWPLYFRNKLDEEVSVFNKDGSFTSEMIAAIQPTVEVKNRSPRPR